MRKVLVGLCLLTWTSALAQTPSAQGVVTVEARQWASVGAMTRFAGTGLTLAYGQQDLFAPGTDGRFGIGYTSNTYDSGAFSLELSADALAYTRDPAPDTSLALTAYGGLGPRLFVQTSVYDYYGNIGSAYLLTIGGIGGLETRLDQFGIFMELEVTIPVLGLVGSSFSTFPFQAIPVPKLIVGVNYFF